MSNIEIPKHALESLARHFLPQIIEFYQDENNVKEYEEWKSDTKKYLKKHDAEISENGMMAKMMAGMGIDKEVSSDNSDSAIADMIIKGISTGTVDMEKKLKQYKDEANEKELELAENFLKFQEKAIDILKVYL